MVLLARQRGEGESAHPPHSFVDWLNRDRSSRSPAARRGRAVAGSASSAGAGAVGRRGRSSPAARSRSARVALRQGGCRQARRTANRFPLGSAAPCPLRRRRWERGPSDPPAVWLPDRLRADADREDQLPLVPRPLDVVEFFVGPVHGGHAAAADAHRLEPLAGTAAAFSVEAAVDDERDPVAAGAGDHPLVDAGTGRATRCLRLPSGRWARGGSLAARAGPSRWN